MGRVLVTLTGPQTERHLHVARCANARNRVIFFSRSVSECWCGEGVKFSFGRSEYLFFFFSIIFFTHLTRSAVHECVRACVIADCPTDFAVVIVVIATVVVSLEQRLSVHENDQNISSAKWCPLSRAIWTGRRLTEGW